MERVNFTKKQANEYVKEAFEDLGLTGDKDNITIKTFVSGNDIRYQLIDIIYYKGKMTPKITNIGQKQYLHLLKTGLKLHGYEKLFISPNIKGKEVSYQASAMIVDFDNKKKKKRRRNS